MQKPPISDPLSSCSSSEPFALQVIGDSMEPEFPDGCIVLQGHLIQVAWGHRIAGEDAVIVVAAGG